MKGRRQSNQITIVWCQVHVIEPNRDVRPGDDEDLAAIQVRRACRVEERRLVTLGDSVRAGTGVQQQLEDFRLNAVRALILADDVDGRSAFSWRRRRARCVDIDRGVANDDEQLDDRLNHSAVVPRRRRIPTHLVQDSLSVQLLVQRRHAKRTTISIDHAILRLVALHLEDTEVDQLHAGRLA